MRRKDPLFEYLSSFLHSLGGKVIDTTAAAAMVDHMWTD